MPHVEAGASKTEIRAPVKAVVDPGYRVISRPGTSRTQCLKEFKLVVVGEGGVGKTALTLRFVCERFIEEYDPTLIDSYRKQVVIGDEAVLVDVTKTAHQAGFGEYVRMGEGFLLVYSIAHRDTFESIRRYHEHIRQIKGQDALFAAIIVANKCDLEAWREVSIDEGREVARQLDCTFMETSAKHGTNIEEAFVELVRQIQIQQFAKQQAKNCGSHTRDQGKGDHSSRCSGCVVF
ncbi:ras family-domain-containing protein [Mycena haematopus]|nr:ras family-domain-containing protein [Mycena haematopus]